MSCAGRVRFAGAAFRRERGSRDRGKTAVGVEEGARRAMASGVIRGVGGMRGERGTGR